MVVIQSIWYTVAGSRVVEYAVSMHEHISTEQA